MSVLVTGASGFLGTWVLRELLERGLQPIGYDRQPNLERWQRVLGPRVSEVPLVSGSLLDRHQLARAAREHHVTHLIHLAALLTPDCQRDPYAGCEVNIMGSVALFEIARSLPGQILGFSYASSYAVYGAEPDDRAIGLSSTESSPPSFYGAMKLAVDLIAEQYWRHFGVASVGIRPHVIYGPERNVGLTAGPSLAARAAARHEPYSIGYTGSVSYDYVCDVARAFIDAALATPSGSHVVDLPGEIATTETFVQHIANIIPSSAGSISISGPAIPPNIPLRPCYITTLFPTWTPTPLAEGIRATIEFYL